VWCGVVWCERHGKRGREEEREREGKTPMRKKEAMGGWI